MDTDCRDETRNLLEDSALVAREEEEEDEEETGERSHLSSSIQVSQGHIFDPNINHTEDSTNSLITIAPNIEVQSTGLDRNQEIRSKPPKLRISSTPEDTDNTPDQVRRVRNPVHFHNYIQHVDSDPAVCAAISRYKYYKYLEKINANQSDQPTSPLIFTMPDHVVPPQFITIVSISNKIEAEQGSLITIFSLWNTMMGTSILSIPWTLKMAGFANGVILLILMAALMCYSAYRIVDITHSMGEKLALMEGLPQEADYGYLDFSDVCQHYLGKFGLYTSIICSLMSLVGGMIVYWILMSNFLYNTVSFFANPPNGNESVLCPNETAGNGNATEQLYIPYENLYTLGKTNIDTALYNKVWNLTKTVPVFVLVLLFPLLNFKSPTFFTKFNSLATISVTYLMAFTVVKATEWGINIDFKDKFSDHYSTNISPDMAALTGVAALAYFIHNCVLSILRCQKKPEHGVRNLGIAFFLVCFTYIFIGVGLYISFPLPKSCIEDNLLNNLPLNDNLAFVARLCMLLQMVAVFPLLIYVFRVQFFHVVSGNIYPGLFKVIVMNLVMCTVSILFACFLPKIGKVIGFVGAFCGFSYALGLPFLIHLISLYEKHQLTWYSFLIHTFLILLGFANFVAQFFISGH